MDAIILAGGLGTRLRSVVSEVPKCMAPVCDKPFLYYLFTYLKKFNEIDRIILSVGYKYEVILEWLDAQNEFPFEFVFSIENEPLGTGGAIKKALELAKSEQVIVLNGDTLFDVNIAQLIQLHRTNQAVLSIALKPMVDFNRYGNVETNELNQITAFREKMYCKEGQINGGVYIIDVNLDIMAGLPAKFSFETDILQPQVANRKIYGFGFDGYFIDIGIPEDYEKANKEFIALF